MDDLFVVNTVAHPAKIAMLAELARDHRILVAVDEASNAAAHSAAAVEAGSTLGIMVEVDTGMDRCGVDTAQDALALARQVMDLPGLRIEGITGYEGHCSLTIDSELRHERQREAMKFFTGVADLLEANGIPCPIRSAGGIATWNWTAGYPGITEIQAGTYVVMDNYHGQMVPGFEHSLTIQASVISRQSGKVIVDTGNKSVAAPTDVTMVGHDHHGLPVRRGARHLLRSRRLAAGGGRPGGARARVLAEHRELVRRVPRSPGRRRRRHLADHPARPRPPRPGPPRRRLAVATPVSQQPRNSRPGPLPRSGCRSILRVERMVSP